MDVNCQADCVGVPHPSELDMKKTTSCIASCDQGDGSMAASIKYTQCRKACIDRYVLSSTRTDMLPATITMGTVTVQDTTTIMVTQNKHQSRLSKSAAHWDSKAASLTGKASSHAEKYVTKAVSDMEKGATKAAHHLNKGASKAEHGESKHILSPDHHNFTDPLAHQISPVPRPTPTRPPALLPLRPRPVPPPTTFRWASLPSVRLASSCLHSVCSAVCSVWATGVLHGFRGFF